MYSYAVLIIDDDESTHEILGEYLRLAGFKVLGARDGAAGIQMIEECRPDIVLLDVNMPVMDGFRAMELISSNRQLRNVPVIFVTSLDRYNLKIKGLELGAEDYVVKPFNRAELLARVKAALRRGERYRRNEETMVGALADIGLAELLQTLDIGRKTACLHLKEIAGSLCTEAGNIIGATYRDFTGLDAVMRMFLLEQGTFSLNFDLPPSGIPPCRLPIQSTLFGTVTYVDELKQMARSIATEDALLEFTRTGITEIDRLAATSPCRLYDLIALMEGELKENCTKISRAAAEQTITVVRTEESL